MAATSIERFSVRSSDAVDISVQKTGSGPSLLLVHGSLLNGTISWGAVLPKFAQHFAVYAMDRRGRAPSGDAAEYILSRSKRTISCE
jgi:pimeloyl-ACP methyl ester carboxylesterase